MSARCCADTARGNSVRTVLAQTLRSHASHVRRELTRASRRCTSRLKSADLPTLGRPTMATCCAHGKHQEVRRKLIKVLRQRSTVTHCNTLCN